MAKAKGERRKAEGKGKIPGERESDGMEALVTRHSSRIRYFRIHQVRELHQRFLPAHNG